MRDMRGPVRLTEPPRLPVFAWGVLAYNLAVIAWGAFVRASGSGAGCGRHWPLCNGEVVPRPTTISTVIEATHRLTSGIAVVLVIALLVATRRALPSGHRARRTAGWATVSIFGEALIGAGLVLFELVAHDASTKRALSMVLHLGNTFVLLAMLSLTAWWWSSSHVDVDVHVHEKRPYQRLLRVALAAALSSVLLLGASGAIAALGDTLFPASSLKDGFAKDFSPVAHLFLRLRLLHPVIALASGVLVIGSSALVRVLGAPGRARTFARIVTLLFVAQFTAGVVNLTLLAPIPMQLVHLLLADATWIALVLMAAEAVLYPSPSMSRNGPAPASDIPPSTSSVAPVT
jgi:heme A synthase